MNACTFFWKGRNNGGTIWGLEIRVTIKYNTNNMPSTIEKPCCHPASEICRPTKPNSNPINAYVAILPPYILKMYQKNNTRFKCGCLLSGSFQMPIPKQKSWFSVDNSIFTLCCMLIGRIV